MGRPLGSKNKPKVPKVEDNANMDVIGDVRESRKDSVKPELPEFNPIYEKLFEAPDGNVIVGGKEADRLWYREGNNGNGMWILPKR